MENGMETVPLWGCNVVELWGLVEFVMPFWVPGVIWPQVSRVPITRPDFDTPLYIYFRWTPQPVTVTIMDNKDYIRVLLYSHHTTITG